MPPVERTAETTRAAEEEAYRVDDLIIDVGCQRVTRGDTDIPLPKLSFELLLALARAAPNVRTFDQLIERVWSGLVVSPETVSQRVKLVRDALGDNPHTPRYIAGVRGRGYRMLASVTPLAAPATAPPGGRAREPPADRTVSLITGKPRRWWSGAAAGVGVLLALTMLIVYLVLPGESARQTPATNSSAALGPVDPSSIAVARFLTIGDNPEARVFIDGLAEDVLDRLARVPGLSVSSRTDAWALPPEAGSDAARRRLRVAWLLEGSVRLEDNDLRVTVQLIDTATGFHRVSRTFDRKLENFMEVQEEITELTVATLRVALPADEPGIAAYADTDVDVYMHYRRGREIFERPLTIALLEQSMAHFEDALALDPGYAAAHAGLCRAYVSSYTISGDSDYIEQAESACANALATYANLPTVYTALGKLYQETNRLTAAENAFRQALELNDQDVEAMQGLAWVYERENRLAEAQALFTRAMRLQPGNWRIINSLGALYFTTGEYRKAAAEFRKVVYLDPGNWQVLGNLGSALAMGGNFGEAAGVLQRALDVSSEQILYSNLGTVYYYMRDFERSVAIHRQALAADPNANIVWLNLADALYFAGHQKQAREAFRRTAELSADRLSVNPGDAESLQAFAWASMMLGDAAEARRAMDRALQASPNDPRVFYYDALIRARTGDRTGALAAIEQAVAAGYPRAMLAAEPYLQDLRNETRFGVLVESQR